MSKVIKSCFVKKKEKKDSGLNSSAMTIGYGRNEGALTRETAHTIYQETKIMIEELVSEAQKKAETIICEAEREAEKLKKKSEIEYEQVKQKAYQEGIQSGYHEGREKGEEEIKSLAAETKKLAQNLSDSKEKYFRENAENIIDLVLTIVQKIVNTIVELKPEIICSIVTSILEEVGAAEKLIIKVNPLHLPYLDAYDRQGQELKTSKLSFIGDPEIKLGGCVLEAENGFVDAQIEEQLLLLKKALKEENNYVRLC
ncbi:MAG: FliH/SctL family protein [Clostridia bacterium]|nr:FliH/SctL family protein [Clostridia bacterium]